MPKFFNKVLNPKDIKDVNYINIVLGDLIQFEEYISEGVNLTGTALAGLYYTLRRLERDKETIQGRKLDLGDEHKETAKEFLKRFENIDINMRKAKTLLADPVLSARLEADRLSL